MRLETGRLQHESKKEWQQAVDDCMAIARNSARNMSNKSGLQYDELESEAVYALGVAFTKRDRSYGFYSYAKRSIDGYLCNFLRDKVRPVRLPRHLADLHVAVLRYTKRHPLANNKQIAAALSCSMEDLLQVQANGSLFASSLEDKQYGELIAESASDNSCEWSEVALQAIQEGVSVMARRMQIAEADLMEIVSRGLQDAFASRYTSNDNR
jgi:DNA-directed RNA polymerase specialized sigma subunit